MDWKEEMRKVAKNAKLRLTEQELEELSQEIGEIIRAFEIVERIGAEEGGKEEAVVGRRRKDEARKYDWDPFCCAKHRKDRFFVGPRLVAGE